MSGARRGVEHELLQDGARALRIPPIRESERGAQFAELVVVVVEREPLRRPTHRAGVEAGFRDDDPSGVREPVAR